MEPDTRIQKLLKASEIIKNQDDRETEIDKLVAVSMQTGYEIGRLEQKPA